MATASISRTWRAVLPVTMVTLCFALTANTARAAEQIDQSNLPEWDGGWTHVNPDGEGRALMWQTFTPSLPNLTAVEIDIRTISPGQGDDVLTVEIAKDGEILASADSSVADGFDGLLRFEFPDAVPLVPEQVYELKVRDTGRPRFGWKFGSNTYERGSRYVSARERAGSDWFFRTYSEVEPAPGKYSGGSGTADDPYQIATAEDLMLLGETPDDYDKHFILTADIDLDPNLPGRKVFDKAVIAPDMNDVEDWFQGAAFTGLFDGNGYVISNLHLQGGGYLGLFGKIGSGARISNLGLEAVDVSGSSAVGSLVGSNYRGSITTSYSTATVSGNEVVGGLVGENAGSITMSYSTGTVSGDWRVGGLVGVNAVSVTASYSACTVIGEGAEVGGLVGDGRSWHVTMSFWDVEISGQPNSSGGTGLTTAEMQTATTFQKWGTCENEAIWTIDEGRDYPRLWWQNSPGEPIAIGTTLSDFLTGEGTEDSPYLIYTADELNLIDLFPCDYDKHFKLMADIDLSGYSYDRAVIAPDTDPDLNAWGFNPPSGGTFTGVFDGNWHIISNLTITGDEYVGLFGSTAGEVHDLGLDAVDVTGTGRYVGSLVGYNFIHGGSVTNCYATGRVSGNAFVGGLVGYNRSSIMSSYSTVAVSGEDMVGGLVGRNRGVYLDDSPPRSPGTIRDCYATGTVTGAIRVGGLVGADDGDITACYSTGAVTGDQDVGGLMGGAGAFNRWSFWDIETSGQLTSDGGMGKTTAEMQTASTFYAWACGGKAVWTIDEGNDYPRLWWEDRPGEIIKPILLFGLLVGSGTGDDPFLVYTAEELNLIGLAPCDWGSHFRLMADIDMSGYDGKAGRPSFNIIGAEDGPFTGGFDGNGHRISHLSIEGTDCVGLFGCVNRSRCRGCGERGHIRNLGLVSVSIAASGKFVGGLIGLNSGGIISNCYSKGTVIGSQHVGGLVGRNKRGCPTYSGYSGGCAQGSIRSSYSNSTVSGREYVGGLVGTNDYQSVGGYITESYSTGMVDGVAYVGGLVGRSYYGGVFDCFWDIKTSGQSSSDGGTGMATAEMQTASTFLDAAWDFVDETTNGTDDIWWILEGQDYPRLWWEMIPEN